jgi:hypothetical protein
MGNKVGVVSYAVPQEGFILLSSFYGLGRFPGRSPRHIKDCEKGIGPSSDEPQTCSRKDTLDCCEAFEGLSAPSSSRLRTSSAQLLPLPVSKQTVVGISRTLTDLVSLRLSHLDAFEVEPAECRARLSVLHDLTI